MDVKTTPLFYEPLTNKRMLLMKPDMGCAMHPNCRGVKIWVLEWTEYGMSRCVWLGTQKKHIRLTLSSMWDTQVGMSGKWSGAQERTWSVDIIWVYQPTGGAGSHRRGCDGPGGCGEQGLWTMALLGILYCRGSSCAFRMFNSIHTFTH